jgi:hypothetical protein
MFTLMSDGIPKIRGVRTVENGEDAILGDRRSG